MRKLILAMLAAGLIIGPAYAQTPRPRGVRIAPVEASNTFFPCAWTVVITVEETDGNMRDILAAGHPASEAQAVAQANSSWTLPVWGAPNGTPRTSMMYPPNAIRRIQIQEPLSPMCR